jgi:hypothetical protein
MPIFVDGNTLVITTRGVGNLRLFSYQSNAGASNCVGSTLTSNTGVTRFLVSFSHTYERFAFYWDGAGEAVYGIGTGLERKPVGRSWTSASAILWGASMVTTIDATSLLPSALVRDNATTVFIIPDQI